MGWCFLGRRCACVGFFSTDASVTSFNPQKTEVYFVCSSAWSNHHIFQTLLRKCFYGSILRSLACFSSKLYSSLAANSSIHVLQCSTFRAWRLCLRSAIRWPKKKKISLPVICILKRHQLLQTVMQVYGGVAIDKQLRCLKPPRCTCPEL